MTIPSSVFDQAAAIIERCAPDMHPMEGDDAQQLTAAIARDRQFEEAARDIRDLAPYLLAAGIAVNGCTYWPDFADRAHAYAIKLRNDAARIEDNANRPPMTEDDYYANVRQTEGV